MPGTETEMLWHVKGEFSQGPGGSARGPRVPHRASKPHRVPRHACVAAAPRGRLLLAARATRFPLAVQLPRFVAQLLRFS